MKEFLSHWIPSYCVSNILKATHVITCASLNPNIPERHGGWNQPLGEAPRNLAWDIRYRPIPWMFSWKSRHLCSILDMRDMRDHTTEMILKMVKPILTYWYDLRIAVGAIPSHSNPNLTFATPISCRTHHAMFSESITEKVERRHPRHPTQGYSSLVAKSPASFSAAS